MILIPLLAFLIRPVKRMWVRRREERAALATEGMEVG
jgi:hypothetical protein